jgi:hypothetical protein
MAGSGKTLATNDAEAFDFSLARKRELKAERRALVLTHSETLAYEFHRLRREINWDALRLATTEDEITAALSRVDQSSRGPLPSAAPMLATVQDPKYPKLRPIRFLADSCALALQTNPKSTDLYSPRYSRDICYKERIRRGPKPKAVTDLDYWRAQSKAGQRVPTRFLRRINEQEAKTKQTSEPHGTSVRLTYADIPETIVSVKKKRTTVWLPEATVARLKKLAAATGAPMAELFRRAVEAYLNRS